MALVAAAGTTGARAARAAATGRRVLAGRGLRREQAGAALEQQLEVVLRVVVLGVEDDRLLEARDRAEQQLGAVRPAGALPAGVEFQAATLSTPRRVDARERSVGSGSRTTIDSSCSVVAVRRSARAGSETVASRSLLARRSWSMCRKARSSSIASTRLPAPNGASVAGRQSVEPPAPTRKRTSSAGTAVRQRSTSTAARPRKTARISARGRDDEQQLARQAHAPHAATLPPGSASRPA